MRRSTCFLIAAYLLLSAGLYLVVAARAHVGTSKQIGALCAIAGGIFLAQLAYVAVMAPLRNVALIRPWRLILAAVLTTAVLEVILSYHVWRIWHEDDICYWFHGDTGMGPVIAVVLILFALIWSIGPLMVWLYYRQLHRADTEAIQLITPDRG